MMIKYISNEDKVSVCYNNTFIFSFTPVINISDNRISTITRSNNITLFTILLPNICILLYYLIYTYHGIT